MGSSPWLGSRNKRPKHDLVVKEAHAFWEHQVHTVVIDKVEILGHSYG